MTPTYRVREFAKLAGVTVKALHHYDRIGLLKPTRTRAGYRLYSAADRDRLEQIAALKFVGLPLRQIRTLLDRQSPPLVEALARHRGALDEQRKKLDRAIAAIDWELYEAERAKRSETTVRAPDRFNEARISIFRDIATALDEGAVDDVRGTRAQALMSRWKAIIDDEIADVDEAAKAKIKEVWAGRKTWPPSLKRYVASLYQLKPAVWERVAEFIDRGAEARLLEPERR